MRSFSNNMKPSKLLLKISSSAINFDRVAQQVNLRPVSMAWLHYFIAYTERNGIKVDIRTIVYEEGSSWIAIWETTDFTQQT
jgi:hypothetical protein